MNDLRFVYDGDNLKGDETPDSLDMEDGDVIDAFQKQVGGA